MEEVEYTFHAEVFSAPIGDNCSVKFRGINLRPKSFMHRRPMHEHLDLIIDNMIAEAVKTGTKFPSGVPEVRGFSLPDTQYLDIKRMVPACVVED